MLQFMGTVGRSVRLQRFIWNSLSQFMVAVGVFGWLGGGTDSGSCRIVAVWSHVVSRMFPAFRPDKAELGGDADAARRQAVESPQSALAVGGMGPQLVRFRGRRGPMTTTNCEKGDS